MTHYASVKHATGGNSSSKSNVWTSFHNSKTMTNCCGLCLNGPLKPYAFVIGSLSTAAIGNMYVAPEYNIMEGRR